jgi:hypothetical protein
LDYEARPLVISECPETFYAVEGQYFLSAGGQICMTADEAPVLALSRYGFAETEAA